LELAKGPLDAFDANASDKQRVANQAPMPALENRSCAYERAALSGRQFRDPLNVFRRTPATAIRNSAESTSR
jgi:hypothetical protein